VKAELHSAEEYRLAELRRYRILDTPREADFDEVVKVTLAVCGTPISVINLIDQGRQWFKAEVGLGVRETPIDSSICAHAILQADLFMCPTRRSTIGFATTHWSQAIHTFVSMPAPCWKSPRAFRSARFACLTTSRANWTKPRKPFCA
jgi:hypothetical protein